MTKKSCLVVVDMINGFLKEGALSDPSIQNIIPSVKELIEKYQKDQSLILNFQDAHDKESKEFEVYPIHCLQGSTEAELIDELKPYKPSMTTLYKNSTNGFMHPDFLDFFKTANCSEYVVVGCCTDICILQFTLSLQGYIQENNYSTKIYVVKDAVETFQAPHHNRKEYNQLAFDLLQKAGVELLLMKEVF